MSEARRLRDRALDHPLRRQVSAMLCGTELSGPEVTARLDGADLGNVRYHLQVLERAGLIERVGGLWRRA